MRMRDDQIIKLLHVVTLQRVHDNLALARVTCIDKNCLAACRSDQDRVAIHRADIQNSHRQFA
jgi:hypothetical protein